MKKDFLKVGSVFQISILRPWFDYGKDDKEKKEELVCRNSNKNMYFFKYKHSHTTPLQYRQYHSHFMDEASKKWRI